MSTQNNFLKISVFNLEQKIKSKAEISVKDCEKSIKEIDLLIEKIIEREDYPDSEKVLHRLRSYLQLLDVIKVGNVNLFNFIDQYYKFGDQQVAVFCNNKKEAKKKLPKKRASTKPKSPKKPKSL